MSKNFYSVFAYSRATTQEQVQQGHSLELQRKQLNEYAEKNNLEIVGEFSDIGSSVGDKRPGFQKMLKLLEDSENCKTILVTKADRLCRDYKELAELQEKYSVISVNYGSNDMMNQLQIMFTHQYSKVMSKSIKAGLQKRKVEEIKNEEVNMKKSNTNKTKQWIEDWATKSDLQKQNEYEQEEVVEKTSKDAERLRGVENE